MPLSYFHTFTYSKRTGTPAADFIEQVSDAEKQARTQRLIALSQAKNKRFRDALLGQTIQIVVEDCGHQGMSEQFIRVTLPEGVNLPPNTLASVIIETVLPETTIGCLA